MADLLDGAGGLVELLGDFGVATLHIKARGENPEIEIPRFALTIAAGIRHPIELIPYNTAALATVVQLLPSLGVVALRGRAIHGDLLRKSSHDDSSLGA